MSLLLHNTTRAINSERQMHCTDNLALRQAAHVVNFLHSSVLFADSYFKKKKKKTKHPMQVESCPFIQLPMKYHFGEW